MAARTRCAREHELLALRFADFRRLPRRDPSARGELELPGAVALAIAQGVRFKVLAATGPVLDCRAAPMRLTCRSGSRDAAAGRLNGEHLSAELTRHGLDEAESARKRLLGDLALEHFASWPGRPSGGALGPGADRGVRQAHRLWRRPLAGRPGPRGFIFMARVRDDRMVTMADAARGERFSIDLAAATSPSGETAPTGWRRYAATTVHRLDRNFPGAVRRPISLRE